MDLKTKDSIPFSSPLDVDVEEVFVVSTDFSLQCDNQNTSRSQLRVLRHSDSGGSSSISRSPTTEPSPQRNPEPIVPDRTISIIDDALQTEKDFMDYVLSLPNKTSPPEKVEDTSMTPARKTSSRSCTLKTGNKVGLDHLDNLCKLMEQLSDLKEANSRLKKQVQYLEDVKSLHDMYDESKIDDNDSSIVEERSRRSVQLMEVKPDARSSAECAKTSPSRSQDRRYASGIHKSKTQPNMTQKRSRERSKSVGHENHGDDTKSKKRFPKWSKVKEALGWERPLHYETRNGRQIDRKRISARHKVADTSKEYVDSTRRILTSDDHVTPPLRIPVFSDGALVKDLGPEPLASDIPLERRFLVNKESTEELNAVKKSGSKRQVAAGSRRSLAAPSEDPNRRRKSSPSPSPTSLAKQALQDEIRLGQGMEFPDPQKFILKELRLRCRTLECGVDPAQSLDKFSKDEMKKSSKGPWGRVKTIIQTRRDSLKRKQRKGETKGDSQSSADYLSHEGDGDLLQDFETLSQASDRRSVDYLYDTEDSRSASRKSSTREAPKQPIKSRVECDQGKDIPSSTRAKDKKPKPLVLHEDSALLSEGDLEEDLLSPTSPSMQRRSRWNKMRRVFGKREDHHLSRSAPSSPTVSMREERTAFDFENFPDAEDDISETGHTESLSGRHPSTESGGGHPLTSCTSTPVANLFHELQNNISEDFSKKILEWERIRSTGGKWHCSSPVVSAKPEPPNLNRANKNKAERRSQEKLSKQRLKDLNWLEKELQKVEREKERLAKERQKYEEKAARLQKLKETVISARNTNRNEVLIKTSAGEFRFEGISDAFTKKLYEWETKRGVGPDMSTIALLDSSLSGDMKDSIICDNASSILQRGISKSESSVVDTGQPSQTSSNSLPSLKQDNLALQPSRANSEPDLGAYNKELLRALTPRIDVTGSSVDLLSRFTSAQVTELIDEADLRDKAQGALNEEFNLSQAAEDSYYNLLEENMFLLEQLKDKEEICRRLEAELQYLDTKMAEMNVRHQEEMERYREKLWEVHRPGFKPRDLEGSLKMISELKCRIEDLERNSDRLKSERRALESQMFLCPPGAAQDSFRYHSEKQAQLAFDLSHKMKELHEARITSMGENSDDLQSSSQIWNERRFQKLHDLSTLLLKQARDLEQALAERTRQVYHLRWELLNRDVSSMHLQSELQGSRWQSSAALPAKRSPCRVIGPKRCWSFSDGITLFAVQESPWSESHSHRKLEDQSTELCKNWPKVDYQVPGLNSTIHALKIELLKLSSKDEPETEDDPDRSLSRAFSEQSEMNYERPYTSATGHSSPPEAGIYGSICSSPGSSFPAVAPEIKVRRNSADNFSSVSGPECSESSSLNENVSFVLRLPTRRWAADNMSTSSESSYMEHYDARSSWSNSRSRLKVPAEFSSEDNLVLSEVRAEEITVRYPSSLKRSRLRREWIRGNPYRDRITTQEDLASEYSSEDQDHSDGYRSVSCPESPANHQTFFAQSVDVVSGRAFRCITADVDNVPEVLSDVIAPDTPDETPTYTIVLPRRSSDSKTRTEDTLQHKPFIEPAQESEENSIAQEIVTSKDDADTDTDSKWKTDFKNLNIFRDSPIIKSRSHRKLKSENSREKGSDNESSFSIEPGISTEEVSACPLKVQEPIQPVIEQSKYTYEPVSFNPICQARADALLKAKEQFISGTTATNLLPTNEHKVPSVSPITDIQTTNYQPEHRSGSMDSAKIVKCKTSETFDESLMSRKSQDSVNQSSAPKSRSFLNLKLTSKKTQKKMAATAAVGALCRQSLFMNIENPLDSGSKKESETSGTQKGAKSCPSSPRPKHKTKGGWFSKGIFKR